MAGLVPAIRVFLVSCSPKNVDARHKAGHDAEKACVGHTAAGFGTREIASANSAATTQSAPAMKNAGR
jgi:hypothetical protein